MIDENAVVGIAKDTIWMVIKVSLPLLLVSLIIGLIVSIFQTVTSIQEQTLTFIPKFIGLFLAMLLFGNWMVTNVITFTTDLWSNFSYYISGA